MFGFSNQNGEQSGTISRKIVEFLFNGAENKDVLEHIVRKVAHFSLYAVGGFFIYGFTNTFSISTKKKIIITIVVGALYAVSDELHQMFIRGRSGQATDVLIDTCGVIFMMVIMALKLKLSKKLKDIIYTIFLVFLIFAWMFVVFSFSNQDNVSSQKVSNAATKVVVDVVQNEKSSNDNETKKVSESIKAYNPIIRKLAHFSLYTIGGVLIYCLLDRSNLKTRYKVVIAIALGALYACTDEYHQYYISGRTANLFDIWIDSLGVAFGIVVKIQIFNRVKKLMKSYQDNRK